MDKVKIESEDNELVFTGFDTNFTYNNLSKSLSFKHQSLMTGDYTLKIKSIFNTEQTFEFTLSTDTFFFIKNELVFEKVDFIKLKELYKADTIVTVYSETGCFHSISEITYITKNNSEDYYLVQCKNGHSNSNRNPSEFKYRIGSFIIDNLFKLQTESLQLKALKEKEDLKNGVFSSRSTTVKRFSILSGKKVFSIENYVLADWSLFDNFRNRYRN